MSQKLESLREELISVLSSHRITVLEEPVLDLPVKGLRAGPEVFLGKPLRVRDDFFFVECDSPILSWRQPVFALDDCGNVGPLPVGFNPPDALVFPLGWGTAPVAAHHKAVEDLPSA